MLAKLFPFSYKSTSVGSLILYIVLYLLLGVILSAVSGLVVSIVGPIPLVGALVKWVLSIVAAVIDLYSLIGIILSVLVFFKIVK